MANADAQAMETVLVAQAGNDVTQAVMPAVSAALLEFAGAGRNIQFVMGDKYFFRPDAKKICQCTDRLATAIHESGRDQQADVLALVAELAGQAEILSFLGERARSEERRVGKGWR